MLRAELARVTNAHHAVNALLSISYLTLRLVRPICTYLYDTCELDFGEMEVYVFLGCVSAFKSHRALDWLAFFKVLAMLTKVVNTYLFWKLDFVYGIVYAVLCLLHFVLLPEPAYAGPSECQYLNDVDLKNELEIARAARARAPGGGITWLVCFFTPFSNKCIDFAPIYSQLSTAYGDLPVFRFAKVDVNRYPDAADQHMISRSTLQQQLPSLVLFDGGVEKRRCPGFDSKGRQQPFKFSYDNIVAAFELPRFHSEAKSRSKRWRKDKKEDARSLAAAAKEAEASKKTQ